jgi:hypothetical protein
VRFGNCSCGAKALDTRTYVALCAGRRISCPPVTRCIQAYKDVKWLRIMLPATSSEPLKTQLFLQMQLGVWMPPRLQLLLTCCCALCKPPNFVLFFTCCRSLKLSHLKRKAEEELKRSNYGNAADRCAPIHSSILWHVVECCIYVLMTLVDANHAACMLTKAGVYQSCCTCELQQQD